MSEGKQPNIRFKEFEDAWEQRKLGEIVKINSGRDYKKLSKGKIPVYGTGGYMLSVNDKLSDKDSVGIGRKGSIDKPQFLSAPFWTVDTLFFMTPKGDNNVEFIFDLSQLIRWKKYDESTGVPSLSKATISKIPVMVTNKNEQTKISILFKLLDSLIAANQNKLEQLKRLKKLLMQKIFDQEWRFKGFNDPWEQRKLGEMGDTFSGLSGKSKQDFGHGDARFVTYMNVYTNVIAKRDGIDDVEIDNKQTQVKYGDVFFTTSSETPDEVAMTSVWLFHDLNVYLNSFCFGYRPNVQIDPYFLGYLLRSSNLRMRFNVLAQGISRYNISKKQVMKLKVSSPKLSEQKLIGKLFISLGDLITANQRRIDQLKSLKKYLMQNMFV